MKQLEVIIDIQPRYPQHKLAQDVVVYRTLLTIVSMHIHYFFDHNCVTLMMMILYKNNCSKQNSALKLNLCNVSALYMQGNS